MLVTPSDLVDLHLAAQNGDVATIKKFLKNKSPIDLRDSNDYTPLQLAARNGHAACVRHLMRAGADASLTVNGNTALHLASQQGHARTVACLIQHGAPINRRNFVGDTALHIAIEQNYSRTADILLQNNADIHVADNSGWTPLHVAARYGFHDLTSRLIQQGANTEAKTRRNRKTPLMIAIDYNQYYTCVNLVQGGANVLARNRYGENALLAAAGNGFVSITEYFINRPEFVYHYRYGRQLAEFGNRLLRKAVIQNNLSFVNQLLSYYQVLENIHVNNNEIIRIAIQRRFVEIEARLRQIPSLQHYVYEDPNSLQAFANYRENSMRQPTRKEQGILAKLRDAYLPKIEAIENDSESKAIKSTVDKAKDIVKGFSDYLADEYQKAPAYRIDEDGIQGEALPLQYDASLSTFEPYYKHLVHSAWRYLQRPNRWIAPDASFVEVFLPEKTRAANIDDTDLQTLACLCLAAHDEKVTGTVIQILAELARSNNWVDRVKNGKKIEVDNLGPDKPSCCMGVTKRLIHCYQQFPSIREMPILSARLLEQRFAEQLIAESDENLNNLFGKAKALDFATLHKLIPAIQQSFLLEDDETLDDDTQTLLDSILPEPALIESFMASCEKNFGQEQWHNTPVTVDEAQKFDSYCAYANDLAERPFRHYYDKITNLIEGLTTKADPAQQANRTLTFSCGTETVTTSQVNVTKPRTHLSTP